MVSFVDKLVGVYYFLSDVDPKNVPLVDPNPDLLTPGGEVAKSW